MQYLEITYRILFSIGFLSQRAGSDSEPGGMGWGPVGKRNLNFVVFRQVFAPRRMYKQYSFFHLN